MTKLTELERKNYRHYHIPGQSAIHSVKANVIHLSKTNKVNHELSKSLGGIMFLKYGDIKFTNEIIFLINLLGEATEKEMKGFKGSSSFITEACATGEKVNGEDRRVDLVGLSANCRVEFENQKIVKPNTQVVIYLGG